ncbi:hypothetical protein K466DRAFT_590419 [Polyporus arcularius HHB13444]|uniref:Uncharacterized protein n=1 Tax=Polyporus arcularius HHB13444 TaxID=1314778 RepID=A0A5C3NZV0_9APHY|nr:hypothetical protein K466DRAFT_590419 [Polyporus arcularius HHB13444]
MGEGEWEADERGRGVASPCEDDRRRSGPRASVEIRRTCADRPAMRAVYKAGSGRRRGRGRT